MKMKQGEQKSNKELEEQAKECETFNPDARWRNVWGLYTETKAAETEGLWENGRGAMGFSLGFGLSKPVQYADSKTSRRKVYADHADYVKPELTALVLYFVGVWIKQ